MTNVTLKISSRCCRKVFQTLRRVFRNHVLAFSSWCGERHFPLWEVYSAKTKFAPVLMASGSKHNVRHRAQPFRHKPLDNAFAVSSVLMLGRAIFQALVSYLQRVECRRGTVERHFVL